MAVNSLSITNFRCFKYLRLNFSDNINFIYGDNASGKSSLLETIYYLSRVKSFKKIKSIISLINTSEEILTVTATTFNNDMLGISTNKHTKSHKIKFNMEAVHKTSDLYVLLPCQCIHPDNINLFNCIPKIRRHFIDWILFHVKHDLIDEWKIYNRVLSQRNECIKKKQSIKIIQHWDKIIIDITNKFIHLRNEYINQINSLLQQFNINIKLNIIYKWSVKNYKSVLEASIESDIKRGYTQNTINSFDIQINENTPNDLNIPLIELKELLSNGQKKYFSIILFYIQLLLYIKLSSTNVKPILLLDDIFSELDYDLLIKLFDLFDDNIIQLFVTSLPAHLKFIETIISKKNNYKLFHVKQTEIICV